MSSRIYCEIAIFTKGKKRIRSQVLVSDPFKKGKFIRWSIGSFVPIFSSVFLKIGCQVEEQWSWLSKDKHVADCESFQNGSMVIYIGSFCCPTPDLSVYFLL